MYYTLQILNFIELCVGAYVIYKTLTNHDEYFKTPLSVDIWFILIWVQLVIYRYPFK